MRDVLDEIRVPGGMFQLNVGLYTRAGAPLTRAAAAMVKVVVAVSRTLVRGR